MYDLPAELAAGLAQAAIGHRESALTGATAALIERYQADRPAAAARPILGSALAASAYLLYRMPATYAAIRSALDAVPAAVPAPSSQLDLGGGTGAAVWAATDRWPGLAELTVLDNAVEALRAGERLAVGSTALANARWLRWAAGSAELPQADLVTVSYVLSELAPPDRPALLEAAVRAAEQLLVIVEPGTQAGYRRIIAARDQLLAAGWSLVAPCPHEAGCPMIVDGAARDWCHFSARVARTAVHRRIKAAELSYEDEKFSYLVVSRTPVPRPANRVLRHPRIAKGRVALTLCQTPPGVGIETVTKSAGPSYRDARDTGWGDPWPPPRPEP